MSKKKEMKTSKGESKPRRPTEEAPSKRVGKRIVQFAMEHNLTINPTIGYAYFAQSLILLGNCACVPERKKCPCDEALEDIEKLGHCRCALLYKSLEVFRDQYFNPKKEA